MIRKFVILAFVLSAATNSLAGVLPYITGDSDCEGNCCHIVRRSQSQANRTKLTGFPGMRCLMQCEHPAENQGVPERPLLRTERDTKAVALVAPELQTVSSALNARSPQSISRTAFSSNHIYLTTGTLLI